MVQVVQLLKINQILQHTNLNGYFKELILSSLILLCRFKGKNYLKIMLTNTFTMNIITAINNKCDDQEPVTVMTSLQRAFGWCEKVGYKCREFILRAAHSKAFAL